MNKETLRKSEELLKALDIAEGIITQSSSRSETEKQYTVTFYRALRDRINRLIADSTLTSAVIRSGVAEFISYWNESVGIETETFWQQLKENRITYQRREPLRRALERGRFRNVHESMAAAKSFPALLEAKILEPGYSKQELDTIRLIIQTDTKERVKLLQECLEKHTIPNTKYLRFGDSVAYMNENGLWDTYFTENEVQQLMEIWRNFK